MGVGLLEFHQFDVMVQAGREAALTLLDRELLTAATLDGVSESPDPQPDVPTQAVGVG
jgi:hypothetical protein